MSPGCVIRDEAATGYHSRTSTGREPGERANDQTKDPVASGGDGVLHFTSTIVAMKPRARDVIGAAVLAAVLVALVVLVVLQAVGTPAA
jgi:hypothetical protein